MKIVNDSGIIDESIIQLNKVCNLIPATITAVGRELLEREVLKCWEMFVEELPELSGIYVFEDSVPDAFLLEDNDGAFFVVSSGLLESEKTTVRVCLTEAITGALSDGLETATSISRGLVGNGEKPMPLDMRLLRIRSLLSGWEAMITANPEDAETLAFTALGELEDVLENVLIDYLKEGELKKPLTEE